MNENVRLSVCLCVRKSFCRSEWVCRFACVCTETTHLLKPDWRYEKKYSDLPGQIRWKKQFIPALEDTYRKPIRFH
ncbi:39s ribosomal protein mitochondrial precursor [Cystoisospora suis]|uniref:39s ribosomal protein mitochondrial n=1 Tax=Cystoisospora suis TaxID=483139 RepID=A0A2C6LHA1_9APIC|nr:39s ribosomal protein mitochondrial precursor [Cystoisospora suis]